MIFEASPERLILVENDGKNNVVLGDGPLDSLRACGKVEFGRMDPDNDKTLVLVFSIDLIKMGKCSNAVDAGVVPKIIEDNFSLKMGRRNKSLSIHPPPVSIKGDGRAEGTGRKAQKNNNGSDETKGGEKREKGSGRDSSGIFHRQISRREKDRGKKKKRKARRPSS